MMVLRSAQLSRPHGHFKTRTNQGGRHPLHNSLIYGVLYSVLADQCVLLLVSGIIMTLLFSRIFKNILNNLARVTIFTFPFGTK